MPCYHPLKGWRTPSGGITFNRSQGFVDVKGLQVPCGQCIGCRLERTRQWAVRIMHESLMHEISSFVTLTYNNENLPPNASLVKKDLQNFYKRLRKVLDKEQKIRYYASGEYGDPLYGSRPHYHNIIFNYWPKDATFYKNSSGGKLYVSPFLEKIWKKGFVVIGAVTFDTAAYCAKYCMKKINGERKEQHYGSRIPEFAVMSRRPGIGHDYYEKYKDEFVEDGKVVLQGRKMRPPLFYERKLKKEDLFGDHWDYQGIKLEHANLFKADNTDERLLVREKIAQARTKLFSKNTL